MYSAICKKIKKICKRAQSIATQTTVALADIKDQMYHVIRQITEKEPYKYAKEPNTLCTHIKLAPI